MRRVLSTSLSIASFAGYSTSAVKVPVKTFNPHGPHVPPFVINLEMEGGIDVAKLDVESKRQIHAQLGHEYEPDNQVLIFREKELQDCTEEELRAANSGSDLSFFVRPKERVEPVEPAARLLSAWPGARGDVM